MSQKNFLAIVDLLGRMRLVARFPMHDAAWELENETGRKNPRLAVVREKLGDLLKASGLAASDPGLAACLCDLRNA